MATVNPMPQTNSLMTLMMVNTQIPMEMESLMLTTLIIKNLKQVQEMEELKAEANPKITDKAKVKVKVKDKDKGKGKGKGKVKDKDKDKDKDKGKAAAAAARRGSRIRVSVGGPPRPPKEK